MESTSLAGLNPSGAGAAGAPVERRRGGFGPLIWVLGVAAFLVYGVQVKPLERIWKEVDGGAAT
jgi:hypothetical protein